MKKLPPSISRYVKDDILAPGNLLYFKLDKDARILKWDGDISHYFNEIPENGSHIYEFMPLLEGFFPMASKSLILPEIQLSESTYAEIHLFKEETFIWIILFDKTEFVNKIRSIIQTNNENEIKLEQFKKCKQENLEYGVLNSLNCMVFERLSPRKFRQKGHRPDWFNQLFPDISVSRKNFNLIDLFPFIEVFLEESSSIWRSRKDCTNSSPIWTERGDDGTEIFLRSIVVRYADAKYVFVKSENDVLRENQQIMQKAREQSLAFDKLAKADEALHNIIRFKDQFISIVSHDLRSPMSSIMGVAEILLKDADMMGKLNIDQQAFITDIYQELNRLIDYNEKLYHWSNLELGKFQLSIKDYNLDELIQTSIKDQATRLKEKNIEVEYNTNKNIHILADKALFVQALNNLIGNAIKFSHHNSKILLESRQTADSASLRIMDEGVGIPEEILPTLFSGYVESHKDGTSGEKGTGLGLGICKRILDAHNFDIQVDPKPIKGSCFVITF